MARLVRCSASAGRVSLRSRHATSGRLGHGEVRAHPHPCLLPQGRVGGRGAPSGVGARRRRGQPHQRPGGRPAPDGDAPAVSALPREVDPLQDPAAVAVPQAGRRHPGLSNGGRGGGRSQRIGLRPEPGPSAPRWSGGIVPGGHQPQRALPPALEDRCGPDRARGRGGRRGCRGVDDCRGSRLRRQGSVPLACARPTGRARRDRAVGRPLPGGQPRGRACAHRRPGRADLDGEPDVRLVGAGGGPLPHRGGGGARSGRRTAVGRPR